MSDLQVSYNEPDITIRRIKEFGFYIHEFLIQDPTVPVQFEMALQLSFTIETNTVYMMVRVYQHYQDAPADQIIADLQVQNIFEISGLYHFQSGPSQLILPQNLIIGLVSLSVSHTRALMALRTTGTALQEILIPVVNPAEIAKQFFPEMFVND